MRQPDDADLEHRALLWKNNKDSLARDFGFNRLWSTGQVFCAIRFELELGFRAFACRVCSVVEVSE